jgi:predicted  nucleic acid-binding Zn-ribbon protein
MKRTSLLCMAGAALLTVFMFRPSVAGQTASTHQDTLAALLVEVRGLRAAMEQIASVGPSIQLAMGRLQLQEQRISTLVRRADGVRDELVAAHKQTGELQDRLRNGQRELDANPEAQRRSELQAWMADLKQQLARATAEIQRLQTEEADASSQIASEQERWVEINQRLEELDRALTRR